MYVTTLITSQFLIVLNNRIRAGTTEKHFQSFNSNIVINLNDEQI